MKRSADGDGRDRRPFDPRARAERKARAAPNGAPYLAPLALVLAALGLWWLLRGHVSLERAALPADEQVRQALARQGRAQLPDVYGFLSGGAVDLTTLRYAEPAIEIDGGKAQVVALLDADGEVAWRTARARIGYIGRETFGMTPCSVAGWCADGRQFDGLRGVLSVLFRRQDALAAGDRAALLQLVSERYAGGKAALAGRLAAELGRPAPVRVTAWQIRVERDRAIVGEDFEIPGAPGLHRARFTLAREADRWRFVDGL